MQPRANTTKDLDITAEYIARQDIAKTAEAARLAHAILDEIMAFVRPGIRESEVRAFAFSLYKAHALEKPWHMPYIRFGSNTLLTYREKAREDLVFGENDIAFGDIGIVKSGIEGDAGRTIAHGSNQVLHQIAAASKKIFDETLAYWKQHDPDGKALYKAAHTIAEQHGFIFNLEKAGHLIGTYPHQGWKGGHDRFPHKAEKGVWVLEIQIRHPELPYGAFFEDLLL